MGKAEDVAEAFTREFPDCKDHSSKPSIEEVERFMRPLAPISYEVQKQIDILFTEKGLDTPRRALHQWWEANFAVSGRGPHHEFTVNFLLDDPCTCVVPHLIAAIEHSTGDVDPRLIALRDAWNRCGRNESEFHKQRRKS